MKVIVAIDSMKGCLDSPAASRAFASGLTEICHDAEVICVPVADGGEGTAVALSFDNQSLCRMESRVINPLGKSIQSIWMYDKESKTACIDMASAAGLTLIEATERNPLDSTSFGVGQLMSEAVMAGALRILLGLGGAATVDAGLGACQALGLKIIDGSGNSLSKPFKGKMLAEVKDFVATPEFRNFRDTVDLRLLCDVDSPFTGVSGAARVFGPQKGACGKDVEILEKGMENVREVIMEKLGIDLNLCPGSGAAGGMAGGLRVLAGGKIRRGASEILDMIGFDEKIKDADLIFTGEGSADRQTLMGKIPYEILKRGMKFGVPVFLIAGKISARDALLSAGFADAISINSQEIVWASDTVGKDPMDGKVAALRLRNTVKTIINNQKSINNRQ